MKLIISCSIECKPDMIAWLYGSGFPKSHDVSKAIDKMLGAEREVIGIDEERIKRAGFSSKSNTYNFSFST